MEQKELIPQERSISYRSFVNCYYRIIETVLRLSDKAGKEGILALEEELKFFLKGDFFRKGLRLVVDGTNSEIIRHFLTISIEREHDFYRKKLMEIALEGVLCIRSGHGPHRIILLLNSMVDIKNNPIDAVCSKYLSGDGDSLFDIDFDSVILPELEREEVSFIKRAVALCRVIRQEGVLAAESYLDHNGIAARDVFEYGIPMVLAGYDNDFIDMVLTGLIRHEADPVRKNLAMAKKEAVLSINSGENQRILALKLFEYFDKDTSETVQEELLKMQEAQ